MPLGMPVRSHTAKQLEPLRANWEGAVTEQAAPRSPMIKNLWKKMTVGFCVLAIAFAIFGASRGKLHWFGEISADGLATLAGGTLAFLAVMWQIDAEKQAREEVAIQRTVGTALVMLSDITSFHLSIRSVESLRSIDPDTVKRLPRFKTIPSSCSAVYAANSAMLGSLGKSVTQSIAMFYAKAEHFLVLLREYEESTERVYMGDDPLTQDVIARALLKSLGPALEDLMFIMFLASSLLCTAAQVPFKAPDVPIADEKDLIDKLSPSYPALLREVQKSMENAQTY